MNVDVLFLFAYVCIAKHASEKPQVGAYGSGSLCGLKGETMAIQSDAFSRVDLTGDDAKKFKRQVTYGRPKAVARENVERGVNLVKDYHKNGGHLIFKATVK